MENYGSRIRTTMREFLNESVTELKLPKKYIDILKGSPEQGMGYQIVNIELNDGSILINRIVFNSSFLQLEKGDNFAIN